MENTITNNNNTKRRIHSVVHLDVPSMHYVSFDGRLMSNAKCGKRIEDIAAASTMDRSLVTCKRCAKA